jgi:hypothetical protein
MSTYETWVYGYDVETNMPFSQWAGKYLLRPKRCGRSSQTWKSCWRYFFDIKDVVHHEFLHQGQTVNRRYYCELLKCLREIVRRKRPQLWRNNFWFLQHNNVPAHTLLLICDFLANTNINVLPWPPYSPDLAPADVFLFHKLKSTWRMPSSGMRCHVDEVIPSSKTSVYTRSTLRHIREDAFFIVTAMKTSILKSTWKDNGFRQFKRLQKIQRWSYVQSLKRHTRIVSRCGNSVQSGASMQEVSTLKVIRLTQLQACPKNYKQNSSKTFEQNHVF